MEQSITQAFALVWQILTPIVIATLVVGLVVGLVQVVTQIQDQGIAYVLKLVSIGCVVYLLIGFISGEVLDFTRSVWGDLRYFR